jgi:hypothetical protein
MGRIKNIIRNINYLSKRSLWDQREEDIVYLSNKILDDVQYEYDLKEKGTIKPHILDGDESFDLIMNTGKSFVRTGDGEIKIMMGQDQPFQEYDEQLAEGLRRIFTERNDNLLVGINRNYYIPGNASNYSSFYRRYAFDYRQFYKQLLNQKATYIDATLTSFRFGTHLEQKTIKRYEKWRAAFESKDLVIVHGKGVIEKLKYDVFELAKTKHEIIGPAKNAWCEHEQILSAIKKVSKRNSIIVFILGMAGKAMIPELSKEGYLCWDVGHLAKYYNAYMCGFDNTEENRKKFYAPD